MQDEEATDHEAEYPVRLRHVVSLDDPADRYRPTNEDGAEEQEPN
jgi:hypothetical protein